MNGASAASVRSASPRRTPRVSGSRGILLLGGVVAVVTVGGTAKEALPQEVPTGFVWESVAIDFTGAPVGFAFLPDGRPVVVTTNGGVHVVAAGGGTPVTIHTIGDAGPGDALLGVAVDPGWPTRPFLYFYYGRADSVSYLRMFTAAGDLADSTSTDITLSSPYVLLADIPNPINAHKGGTLRFGTDGMLYLSIGDNFIPCEAQDLSSLEGVILRLDVTSMPGKGPGPPPKSEITPADNPFSGPGDNERLVWGWGLRNPFRFTVDPLTGVLYVGDVGESAWEEIDVLAAPAGNNFGWPRREGFEPFDPGDSCGVGNTFTDPIFSYPHDGFTSITMGPIARPAPGSSIGLPDSYDGSVFYADYGKGYLRRIVPAGSSWVAAPPVAGQPNADDWAAGLGYPVDIQQGPDGALYYISLELIPPPIQEVPDGLHRIIRTLPTDAAAARASGEPSLVAVPNPAPVGSDTWIHYRLRRPGEMTLRIYDVAGRHVRTLRRGPRSSGIGQVRWDGREESGALSRAGVYFVRLRAEDGTSALRKLLLIR